MCRICQRRLKNLPLHCSYEKCQRVHSIGSKSAFEEIPDWMCRVMRDKKYILLTQIGMRNTCSVLWLILFDKSFPRTHWSRSWLWPFHHKQGFPGWHVLCVSSRSVVSSFRYMSMTRGCKDLFAWLPFLISNYCSHCRLHARTELLHAIWHQLCILI